MAATPTPLRIIISAFGRGRGNGSAPLPKAVMIRDSKETAVRMISKCTARAGS